MNLVPMRFKGVEWHHNPREITFSCENGVYEHKAPFGKAYIQNTGRRNMVIRGEGELYGADCDAQFLDDRNLMPEWRLVAELELVQTIVAWNGDLVGRCCGHVSTSLSGRPTRR